MKGITKSGTPSLTSKAAITAAGIILLITLIFQVIQNPLMTNNGDYHRAIGGLFHIPSWSQPPDSVCPHLNLSKPSSTMGLAVKAISLSSIFTETNCIPISAYPLTLLAIFTSGTLLAIKQKQALTFPILTLIFFANSFSPLFSSFYEEAALLPTMAWLLYGYIRMLDEGKPLIFILAAALVIYTKAQMIVFFPLLLGLTLLKNTRKPLPSKKRLIGALFLLVSLGANITAKSSDVTANAFNRAYNGIGWAVLDVASWPASNFNQRHAFFYANRKILKAHQDVQLQAQIDLVGTSFWPTGKEIMELKGKSYLNTHITLRSFSEMLLSNGVLKRYLISTYAVALKSDYSLDYLQQQPSKNADQQFKPRQTITRSFGFIYFLLSIAFAATLHGRWTWVIIPYIIALPLVVVLGDGFYEFEKHMIPFFIMLPFLASIASDIGNTDHLRFNRN